MRQRPQGPQLHIPSKGPVTRGDRIRESSRRLVEAYPEDLERDLADELVQFCSFARGTMFILQRQKLNRIMHFTESVFWWCYERGPARQIGLRAHLGHGPPLLKYFNILLSCIGFAKRRGRRLTFGFLTALLDDVITGCAVAQHCCNDDQQSQWENGDFDPL